MNKIKVPRIFWQTLQAMGIAPLALLQKARLSPALLAADGYLTREQFFSIWQVIENEQGIDIGARIVQQIEPMQLPPSVLVSYHSPDVRTALHRSVRYKALCTGEVFHIDQSVDGWRIYPDQSGLTPPVSLVLAAFVMMVGLLRYGTQSPISPQRLALPCAEQPELAVYFTCPVVWHAPQAFIEWAAADLDKPFIAYNQALADMLTQTLDGMANSCVPAYTAQVQYFIEQLLPNGTPKLADIARQLAMSERTLQRHLVKEGAQYQQLLAQVRYTLACRYLKQNMDNGETAYLLGYEEPNSFIRFFTQQVGCTPLQWLDKERSSEKLDHI